MRKSVSESSSEQHVSWIVAIFKQSDLSSEYAELEVKTACDHLISCRHCNFSGLTLNLLSSVPLNRKQTCLLKS